jgi:type II secretory ATPase GspE/PulE/Tfp pilus assembly ATPase PilB-like protein
MPVTQNGSYDVPVMARRDLHGEYQNYPSTSYSSNTSAFASPNRFMSNVRSQLSNGYSAIRDRLTHHNTQQQAPPLNSPSAHGGSRFTRSSSQSSNNGQAASYNLRRRAPIHSTPRDNDSEDQQHQRKTKQGKHSENNEDEGDEYDDDDDEKESKKKKKHAHDKDNFLIRIIKKILHSPIDLLSFIWHRLILGLYAGE